MVGGGGLVLLFVSYHRSELPCCIRLGCTASRLLGLWVRIPPETLMFVSYECCVFYKIEVSESG